MNTRRSLLSTRRPTMALLAALAIGLTVAAPVVAATPANDLPGGAIAIITIPASIDQDTTEATVTPADDIGCGAGGLDQATVWYALTLSESARVIVDASGSDYDVGVNAFHDGGGTPGDLFACAYRALVIDAEAGTTYYLMFADIDENATNGGQLHVAIDLAPPPIELNLTVDATGKVNARTGEAIVSGTITCSAEADFSEVYISLRQTLGRFIVVRGWGFAASSCGPTPSSWMASIAGDNGKFAGGMAIADVSAFACDSFSCADAFVSAHVRLRK